MLHCSLEEVVPFYFLIFLKSSKAIIFDENPLYFTGNLKLTCFEINYQHILAHLSSELDCLKLITANMTSQKIGSKLGFRTNKF